jgi:hypothetical protein
MFGPTRNEVMGGLRKLHSEELHNLYSSPNIIMVIRVGRADRMNGSHEKCTNILVKKPEGERDCLEDIE